jgi:hypothetical protein
MISLLPLGEGLGMRDEVLKVERFEKRKKLLQSQIKIPLEFEWYFYLKILKYCIAVMAPQMR